MNSSGAELLCPPTRMQAAESLFLDRLRETAKFGTALYTLGNPIDWMPYHMRELSRQPNILKTVFASALGLQRNRDFTHEQNMLYTGLSPQDLPAMMVAATHFYPYFPDLYSADASFAHMKMEKAGVFAPRDFEMVPLLIDATISKQSKDPNEIPKIKPILPGSPFAMQRRTFVDAMNNFSVLPDTMTSIAYVCVERLFDGVRDGNMDAIRRVDGSLPRTMRDVAACPVYDSDIIRDQIRIYEKYFFGPGRNYEPQLPSTLQHLFHFEANRDFYHAQLLPLIEQPRIDLAHLFQITGEFSKQRRIIHRQQGGGLLD